MGKQFHHTSVLKLLTNKIQIFNAKHVSNLKHLKFLRISKNETRVLYFKESPAGIKS